MKSQMRLTRTSGSVGGLGGRPPRSTRPNDDPIENPNVAEFRAGQAGVQVDLGNLLCRPERAADAEAEYRRALTIWSELAGLNARLPQYRQGMADGLTGIAEVALIRGRWAEARDSLDRAVALGEALVREGPQFPIYRLHLARYLRDRGRARLRLGEPAGARPMPGGRWRTSTPCRCGPAPTGT